MEPLPDAYAPRRIVPLAVREVDGWRVKPTVVLAQGREIDEALMASAVATAREVLPDAELGARHYRVGVLLVHFGMRFDFVLVGYWRFESELRYATFMRASSDSTLLAPLAAAELATDVWDLKVLAFERDAWVERVLRATAVSDEERLRAYLDERLDTTV